MPASSLPERIGTPPFVNPYLETLDRMQRQPVRPEQLTARAQALLRERWGASERRSEAAFAHGAVGMLAGHTNYFDGFAMLLPLQHGTAVALRESTTPHARLTFEGSEQQWTFDAATDGARRDQPAWTCSVEALVRRLAAGRPVEVAVVSTIQAGCIDTYLAALGVATARALQALLALPEGTAEVLGQVGQALVACIEMPFSAAYTVAAEAARPGSFTLVDAGTGEHLPVEAPARDVLGWGLVDVGRAQLPRPAPERARRARAEEAVATLRQHGFAQLGSLRDLEHRDLQRALGVLPRRLKPVVRHLVTENRRVQKLVVAARRRDWQMFGTLLQMSHASLRGDWKRTNDALDFVVEQVEAMSLDGMYGACVTGRGSCVLVLGQPFVVPDGLDRIAAAFEARFGYAPQTVLL